MDDVLSDGFYQDDFLSRTLSTSLYDKNTLDLSLTDNNNSSHPPKTNNNGSSILLSMQTDGESPNLDFLKLGSPDLEQMFMNIEDESEFSESLVNAANGCRSPAANSTAAFNLEDDLLETNNCFTDTLQQLHDKQIQNSLDSLILDIPIKLEKDENDKHCQRQSSFNLQHETNQHENNQLNSPRYRQRKQSSVRLNTQKVNSNNNNNNKNNWKYVGGYSKKGRDNASTLMHQNNLPHQNNNHRHGQPQHQQSNCVPEQMVHINNQVSLLNVQQHQQQDHQQQHQQQHNQELAFLTQSLTNNYQRHSIQQEHQDSISNSTIAAQNINQIPQQLQQKILQQHLINQHSNHSNVFGQNNSQMNNMQRLNEINTAGIDEHTLKLFVENPHLAPLNLDIQELIKRERKKLRNRIASSKCRKRKLEREGRLEDKVRNLKEKNIELNAVANALKQQICDLKQRVMDHVSEGCQIHMPSC